jgi:hypothetical protein
MMETRTAKVRATLAPRMDPTRYTHSYVVNAVPQYRGFTVNERERSVTHLGLITWNQEDRERRNDAGGQIVRLIECDGSYTIRIVGPTTVRDWSAGKLRKARAHNGEWRDVWTGAEVDGVTLMEAVARLRALRDAMQEDADAYRRGL